MDPHTMSPPTLLSLPVEILSSILTLLTSPSTLLSLALSCKHMYCLAVPRHIDYRVLRLRHRLPAIWKHLALREDLSRSFVEVRFGRNDKGNSKEAREGLRERYPRDVLTTTTRNPWEEEQARIRDILKSLSYMTRLRVFHWDFRYNTGTLYMSAEEELKLIEVLSELTTYGQLESVVLAGNLKCLMTRPGLMDLGKMKSFQTTWNMPNLQSLALMGNIWTFSNTAPALIHILKQCTQLKRLQLPIESALLLSLSSSMPFPLTPPSTPTSPLSPLPIPSLTPSASTPLSTLQLPSLRSLVLFLQSSTTFDVIQQWNFFLENHPLLEEFLCNPSEGIVLPRKGLVNLKKLSCDTGFIESFLEPTEEDGYGDSHENENENEEKGNGSGSPAGTTNTSANGVHANENETINIFPNHTSRLPQALECLQIRSFHFSERFLESNSSGGFFTNLRRLSLTIVGSIDELNAIANYCPRLEWLNISNCVRLDLETWLTALSAFPHLKTFRGPGIWLSPEVDDDPPPSSPNSLFLCNESNDDDKQKTDRRMQRMHVAIMKLVQRCPRLCELDYDNWYGTRIGQEEKEKGNGKTRARRNRAIVIIREIMEDGMYVRYEVRKAKEKDHVYLMDDIFH